MAFNIFSTLNQNLQNFGGDAYDAYQAGKSKVGNVASTINTNLQNFGGDLYDAGNQIKNNVSNFATQSVNTGKQAVNQIQSNVSQFGSDVANTGKSIGKSILAPADRFMTDVTKIGNARKATQYGISEKDKSALMNQMLDAGQYSDDEIIQAVAQLDAEEKARKQKEFSDWESGSKANANIGQKALAGALNLGGGTVAGIGQGTLGIADFATGGKIDAIKQEKQAYDEAIANNKGAFTVGKNIGQIGASFAAPGLGKLAPTGTGLAATAGRGAVYGGVYGAANPIMEKGSDATASDIGMGALGGAAVGAVAGPLLEKVVAPAIGKVAQSTTSGLKAAKFTQGSIRDKIGAGLQASGKNISRGVKSIPMGGETLTRNIPKAIVKRDLGFTPTQRAKIEKITGGDEAQYILKKGLAGKGKEELAEIFMKQSDDAYNGITTKLAKIDKTVKSTHADEALQDILDQLNSSPKIQRAYAKDIVGVENMLKKGEYTLSELNNIRRAYDKVNTGMFTVQGKARSGLENDIDVKVRKGLSDQLQKEAKAFGVDVKGMNTELRAGLEMKDALLSRLSQEERNNFLGLQDLGVSAILSGGNPVSAAAMIAAKKYSEKVAPGIAQKLYNTNKNPNVTRLVSRGNTITPRNKSSGLGLASSTSTPMVSDAVKPSIVSKAKPKATTESALKTTPVVPEKKSIVAKKEATVKTPEIKSEKVPLDTKDFIYKNLDQAEGYIKWHEKMLAIPGKSKKDIKYLQDGLEEAKREVSAFKNNKGFINPSEIKKSLVPKKGADEAKQFYDDLVYAGNSPIVAQRETAKRFGTIRAMSASKAGTFGGEGAKEAPKTGWFKGADGKMKFEIDDSGAKIKPINQYEAINGKTFQINDILQHDELFKQYPKLKGYRVEFTNQEGTAGQIIKDPKDPAQMIIKLSKSLLSQDPKTLKSTLLHEIQHGIQDIEGFARGGSPDRIYQEMMNDPEYIKKTYGKTTQKESTEEADKMYKSLAGEVESRNVQTRMNMTAKERALKSPRSTEDVPRSKQIVRLKNDGTSMSIDKAGTMDIGKAPDALVQEAKKYNSADEFIKAQGQMLYHGGGNIKEVGNMRSKWQAFYMTDNPTYAKSYGGPNSVLNEIVILPKAKIVDMLNLSDDFLGKLNKMLFDSNKLSRGAVDTIIKGIKDGKAHFAEDPNVKAILKKMGYDGMITRESKFGLNYGVWNKNVLKTESQLKQIYDQANKK